MPSRFNNPFREIFISVPGGQQVTYTRGDVIRGNVRVKVTSRPQKVTITFRGRQKCQVAENGHHQAHIFKAKPDFFVYTLELYSSPTLGQSYDIVRARNAVISDDRVDLPFEFAWPDQTDVPLGPEWLPSEGFEHECGGPLPPTYSRYCAHNVSQSIEYFLEASLYTDGRYSPAHEVRLPLKFYPLALTPHPIPPPPNPAIPIGYRQGAIITRTHRLHPEYEPNQSWRARLKNSITQPKDITWARYKIDVSVADVVTVGDTLRLKISFDHLDRSENLPDPPPVYLRRVVVKTNSRLNVRVPKSRFKPEDVRGSHGYKCTLLDSCFLAGQGLLLVDGMVVITNELPSDIFPSFTSYGLELNHKVKVELSGSCAKEPFRFVTMQKPFSVVALEMPPGDSPAFPPPPPIDAEGAEAQPPVAEEDVPPPPYQVLDKSN